MDTMFFPIGFAVFFLIAFFFIVVLLSNAVYLVRQAEVIVVERLGRYDRILTAGLHWVWPFVDRARQVVWSHLRENDSKKFSRVTNTLTRIDLREAVYDFPKQNVITKDNVTMEISAILYSQITNPKAAIYEVSNLPEAIEKLTQTTLRNVIGSLDLDETLISRDRINEKLRHILDDATEKWGVKVNRVELQEVNPPADIRIAMEKQMRAERDRRAVILEAEGLKQAAILQSEGHQQSQVLQAQGESEARLIRADAEARTISMMRTAAQGDPLPYLIAVQYIRTLPEIMQGKNDKVILVPYEASALAGSLAGMKTIFEHTK